MAEIQKNEPALWREDFPWPSANMHKYDRGHAVVCGGDEKTGAARLAAVTALRVGAGLVTITCSTKIFPIYASSLFSVMICPTDNDEEFKVI